jgi:hypothetical protein
MSPASTGRSAVDSVRSSLGTKGLTLNAVKNFPGAGA